MTESLISLGPGDLALAAGLLILPAIISFALRLGLGRRLVLAGIRTVLQLAFVGLVLEWVFALDRWYWVLPVLVVMMVAAARAAVNRSAHRYRGAYLASFGSLVLATGTVTFATTELIIGVPTWHEPQYVIPLLGMLLGNGLTGISLSLDRLLNDLVERREAVEARLALGAPLWTAVRPWVADAVRVGLTPILNSMMVVGIVSLPGMMTGQILAGADPADAVAYQILVMFMIAGATAAGTILLCLATYRILADPLERLRWERIQPG